MRRRRSHLRSGVEVGMAAATWFEPLEPRTLLSVFTVTNTNDSGDGSLRQAILDANALTNGTDEPDRIEFAIGGAGVQVISPDTPLPSITQPVVIDGYTQPGASENTQVNSSDAVLLIVLDGSNAIVNGGEKNGLVIETGGDGSTIRGLVIHGWESTGIVVFNSDNNIIEGNFIGTNAAGTQAAANGDAGIEIIGGSNNLIGGITSAARNVISGNGGDGIDIFNSLGTSSDDNLVQGNFIGVDATGAAALGNDGDGIEIFGLASDNVIGGADPGAANVISGNNGDGIEIFGSSVQVVHRNTVMGNFIGTNALGSPDLGNTGDGIEVFSDGTEGVVMDTLIRDNVIAHNQDGDGIEIFGNTQGTVLIGNTIRDNQGTGVLVDSSEVGVAMLGNFIFDNRDMPIDLDQDGPTPNDPGDEDEGANRLQNFPELSDPILDGNVGTVQGTLNSTPDTTFHVEIFVSNALDASGNGQAQTLAATQSVTTDENGLAVFTVEGFDAGPGRFVTATATDPENNTSEISPGVQFGGDVATGFEFGKDSTFGKPKRVFFDADGTRVIFQLNGRGVGTVVPVGGDAEGNGATAYEVHFTGTDGASKAAVKVKGGEDGEVLLAGVTADNSLNRFIAKNVNLAGDMTVAGTLRRLVLDDASEGGGEQLTIRIEGAGATGNEKLNATFDALNDATIVSQIPIKKITADDWVDRDGGTVRDSLTAPSLDVLNIRGDRRDGERGDLDADITLTDANSVLKKLLARGLINGAVIRTAGDIGDVRAGAMGDATIFAGVAEDAPDGALPTADQIGDGRIKSLKITGSLLFDVGFGLASSHVAASQIGNIDARFVDTLSGDTDFGFAAVDVQRYRRDGARLNRNELATPGEKDREDRYVLVLLDPVVD